MEKKTKLNLRLLILSSIFSIVIFSILISCSALAPSKEKADSIPTAVPKKMENAVLDKAFVSDAITIKEIDDIKEIPYGMWVSGTYGDYLLKNKKFMVIISSLDKKIENLNSGGNIIDIANLKDPLDQFGHLYFKYGQNIPPAYVFNKVEIKSEGYPNNAAALIVSGKDTSRDVFIKTEYIIEPDSPYIRIVTTIDNKTTETLKKFNCADHANYGALASFIEGKGSPNPDREVLSESNWLGAQKDNFSMGIMQIDGILTGVSAKNETGISYKIVDIPANQKFEFERYLIVADRNLSNISDLVYEMKKIPFGYLSGKVINPQTKEGVGGVDVQFSVIEMGGKDYPRAPLTRTYSAEEGVIGSFTARVPAGKFFVRSKPFARQVPQMAMTINVKPGETHALELQVSPENIIKYKIVDKDSKQPIPCKLTFQAVPPTQFLDFGFPKSAASRNTLCSEKGEGETPINSGSYRVYVSAGPEYELFQQDMSFGFGKENLLNVELKRVVDTTGYVSVDIGVKTKASFDCPVDAKDRIIQALAEGVEIVVSGDINTITDLEPVVNQLGVGNKIKTIIGKRILSTGKNPYGEYTVFPISKERVANPPTNEQFKPNDYKTIFNTLRSNYPGALIQINRPIFPYIGYFTMNGYNPETKNALEKLPNIPTDFDLFELWEGKKGGTELYTQNTQLYFNLLMKGFKPTLSASTNSNYTYGEEVGYPRVYVASSTDDPAKININEIVDNLKKGKTIVTNGPFIRFTVNGKGPGEIVTDTDGEIDCSLEIVASPWVDTAYIDVNKDGVFAKRIFQAPSEDIIRYPREGSDSKKEFKVTTKRDVILNIGIYGRRSLDPVVAPLFYGEGGGIIALAMTGPIFVDFDGNGKYDPPKSTNEVGN